MAAHHCEECDREFSSKEALDMHNMHKHTSKEEREEKLTASKDKRVQSKKNKNYALTGLAVIVLGAIVFYFLTSEGSYTKGSVHWHSEISIELCGTDEPLPRPVAGQEVHGQSFVGTTLLHLHSEPKIHMEGVVIKKEDITLSEFADAVGITFTKTSLMDKTNGELCPDGTVGKVKLFVNGKESNELDDKVLVDGQKIKLYFGE